MNETAKYWQDLAPKHAWSGALIWQTLALKLNL